MSREIERRDAALSGLRVAGGAEGAAGLMSGRAITYGALSEDLGGYRERFMPGSVRLAPDMLVLHNHDSAHVLGRTSAGTARLRDDGAGIVFEVDPPDTTWARDLAVSMRRGDVRQCSFLFRALSDDFYYDDKAGCVVREVRTAEVAEISIVAMPAYPDTDAALH